MYFASGRHRLAWATGSGRRIETALEAGGRMRRGGAASMMKRRSTKIVAFYEGENWKAPGDEEAGTGFAKHSWCRMWYS